MKTFEKVIPFVKKNLHKLLFGIILIVIIDAGQLYTIKIMQKAIDSIGREGFTTNSLLYASLFIVGITVLIILRLRWWSFC